MALAIFWPALVAWNLPTTPELSTCLRTTGERAPRGSVSTTNLVNVRRFSEITWRFTPVVGPSTRAYHHPLATTGRRRTYAVVVDDIHDDGQLVLVLTKVDQDQTTDLHKLGEHLLPFRYGDVSKWMDEVLLDVPLAAIRRSSGTPRQGPFMGPPPPDPLDDAMVAFGESSDPDDTTLAVEPAHVGIEWDSVKGVGGESGSEGSLGDDSAESGQSVFSDQSELNEECQDNLFTLSSASLAVWASTFPESEDKAQGWTPLRDGDSTERKIVADGHPRAAGSKKDKGHKTSHAARRRSEEKHLRWELVVQRKKKKYGIPDPSPHDVSTCGEISERFSHRKDRHKLAFCEKRRCVACYDRDYPYCDFMFDLDLECSFCWRNGIRCVPLYNQKEIPLEKCFALPPIDGEGYMKCAEASPNPQVNPPLIKELPEDLCLESVIVRLSVCGSLMNLGSSGWDPPSGKLPRTSPPAPVRGELVSLSGQ